MPPTSRHWIYAPLAVAAVGIVLLVALDLQVTAEHQMRLDLVFRSAVAPGEDAAYQVADPSTFSIAASTDRWLHGQLRAGSLPLWDPAQGGGYSPAVQGNVGVWFPLRWITAALPVDQAPSALAVLSAALAYLGFFLFGRHVGLLTVSAAFSGLVYVTSAVFSVQLLYDGGAVLLFLPWLLLADGLLAERVTPARVALAAALFGLAFLSGHHMLLFVVFIGVAIVHVLRWAGRKRGARRAAVFGGASVAGAALAAFALLPFVVDLSSAWAYKREAAHGVSYAVSSLAAWLRANEALVRDVAAPDTLADSARYYHHLGVAVVALALIGAAAAWRRTGARWVPAFLVAAWLLAVPGPWMEPLAPLPPLVWVRNFYMFSLLAGAGALAAGFGLDVLVRSPQVGRLAPVVAAGFFLAGPGVAALRAAPLLAPRAAAPLPDTGAYRFLRDHIDDGKVTGSFGHVHLPNAADWTGIPDARIILVAFDRRHHAWWELVDPRVLEHSYPTTRLTPEPGSQLLPAFGVRYFLEGKLPHHVYLTSLRPSDAFGLFEPRGPSSGAPIAWEDGILRIYALEDPAPRAFVPTEVAHAGTLHEAGAWLRANAARVPGASVVEGAPGARGTEGTVRVVHARGRQVILEATLDAPGLVVINERYDEGWRAWVGDERATVLPVNVVARGVIVPEGTHTIRMRYTPPGFVAGSVVSVATLAALLFLLIRRRP